jgi:Domain of unknown function (DUF2017)
VTWDPFPEDDVPSAGERREPGLAASFRPVPGGAAAFFEEPQAGVIRSLVGQVAELVSADAEDAEITGQVDTLEAELGLSSHVEPPDDPVLARLLPDAYSNDPQASAEFRRYTEETLRSAKVASAQVVLASLPPGGGEVRLSEPECQQWLRALNDVRLALSVRLGITDEDDDLSEHLAVDDPRSAYIWVYQWLAYLQDSLLDALT